MSILVLKEIYKDSAIISVVIASLLYVVVECKI